MKREKHLTKDQGECRDGESTKENTKQAFRLEFDCETRISRNSSHKLLPRPLLNSCGPRRSHPIRETSLDRALKNVKVDCAGGMLISTKKLESVLSNLKNGKGSPDQITAGCFESIPPGMTGKAGEIVVGDVLGRFFQRNGCVL